MKKTILGKLFTFAALLLCCAAFLCSCGGNDDNTPTPEPTSVNADYTVNVVDATGKPVTDGVVVKFLQDGKQISMQIVNENGSVTKNMLRGNYDVELLFTAGEESFYYNKENNKLSAERTSLEILVANRISGEVRELGVGDKRYSAYSVSEGGTYTTLDKGNRNYFLFCPDKPGQYKFYLKAGEGTIGYYGSPHFVQSDNVAETKDDVSFSMNIYGSMISSQGGGTVEVVIGIDPSENTNDCIICIERIGDPELSYDNEPFDIYNPTVSLNKYTLPADAELKQFDLTASTDNYNLVLNENDGFYHLGSKDGPLVLVSLTEKNDYLASFKTILETSGVVRYFFDEEGNFLKKESYSECLLKYIENADTDKGVYPLTADLMYIIQQRGDYVGWFDSERDLYLFKDTNGINIPGINKEISWLFMCCYIEA
ncbi:MAG: hypothetical protein E7385_00775 [Ruminococcaceae bacterium]|nr:hypothetical protein [Oscillospiraceae bacterium]